MKFKDFPVKNTTLSNVEIDDYAKKLKLKTLYSSSHA